MIYAFHLNQIVCIPVFKLRNNLQLILYFSKYSDLFSGMRNKAVCIVNEKKTEIGTYVR